MYAKPEKKITRPGNTYTAPVLSALPELKCSCLIYYKLEMFLDGKLGKKKTDSVTDVITVQVLKELVIGNSVKCNMINSMKDNRIW